MIHLKAGYGIHTEYAVLLEPEKDKVYSDLELFSAVTVHGSALIQKITNSCELDGQPERLQPAEFENKWRTD